MKKLISSIIITILLFSCLGVTVFAQNTPITISDDYQNLYMDGKCYSRFNASMLEVDYREIDTPVELSSAQQETVQEVLLNKNDHGNIVSATIYFLDGSVLTVSFLQDDYLDEYNEIVSGQTDGYLIDFIWPEENTVAASKADLFDTQTILKKEDLEWCDSYNVVTKNDDGSIFVLAGSLLILEDEYYYVDFAEINLADRYRFLPYDFEELPVYEITNAELISAIKEAEDAFYEDDLGFLYNDDLTESISAVFLVFVFAVIPLAILVVFLILAIRAKAVYKKMFHTIWILSAAELAIFAVIASFVMMLK